MASTQTIIINSDGSIKQRVLGEYINQGNDLVDTIYIGFVDDTIASSYVGTANFELPNGDTNTLVGTYVSGITLPNDTTNYKGYKIVLTQAQTIYNGQLKMSFVVTNGEEILYSYKTTFTINASVVAADEEKITLAQWNSLVDNLATYQVAYNEYNVRGYSSQEKANNDYSNLDTDQISIFSDGSNLYYFKGGEDELSATKIANYDDISKVSNALPITGGTMQGDIDMNAKSLTNVNKVNFAPSIDVGSIAELKSEVDGENIYLRLYSKNVNATALACEMSWLTDGGINFYKSISANKGVTNLPTPTNDSDAVNKEYVDNNVNGLNESINNLREVAEGKTKSIVFSYADVTISSSYFGTYRKFYKPNGTEITSWEEFCAYIGKNATTTSYTSNNSIFNSQDNYIDVSITDAKWFAFTSIGSSNYTIYALNSNNYDDFFSALKTGDILLITETDVPDRWFDKYATSPIRFWKMETSKVDITKYVLKSGDTMSGALKINEIDNTSGNALVRFKSTESKNVFGGSNFNCLLMGSGDRPYYSKDGSDFSGVELALKSDITSSSGGDTYYINMYFGSQLIGAASSAHFVMRHLSANDITKFKTRFAYAVGQITGASATLTYDEAIATFSVLYPNLDESGLRQVGGYVMLMHTVFGKEPRVILNSSQQDWYNMPIIQQNNLAYVIYTDTNSNSVLTADLFTYINDITNNASFGGISIGKDSDFGSEVD